MTKLIFNSCKICGLPQGRKLNALCWEKHNVCSRCWKVNYRPKTDRIKKEKQSCKVCGIVRTNRKKLICWEDNLCGICFSPVNKIIRLKKKKVCKCGEVLVKLNYIKRGIHVGTNMRICTKCSYITLERNPKYRVSTLIE